MVYNLYRVYYMILEYVLECFQIQVHCRELWWFWSFLRCRTSQMRPNFSHRWRPFHFAMELIFWRKIELWVIFPLPPVLRSIQWLGLMLCMFYWRVVRLYCEMKLPRRWSCQGDEGTSIDGAPSFGVDRWWSQKTG